MYSVNFDGLFDLSPRGYRLDRDGFATDARNLRSDFEALGGDMENALKKESVQDEPSDKRQCKK